ncbi:Uridylate kinase [Methanosarcinaceae archaeon Ag5]|uniref:Uridylate kinase n=1 Tax=Methanolapillus africanus TaxID=3028297 RepID=A0AAE4MJM4_9EURY|nr:Uridylate kinase [Methanosarcinaceae archaeon Ag5]
MLIVMSLGGSILAGDLDPLRFKKYADALLKMSEEHRLLIVVGGGVSARKYIEAARGAGADEVTCDFIGIDITRLNAKLLIAALGDAAYPEVPQNYNEAAIAMQFNKIVVMGGVLPGQTTDAVSAALSEYLKADLLIIPTSVDGIYTADPNTDKTAKKYETMTATQLVQLSAGMSLKAGSKSPIDPIACKLIERCGIRTIVMDGRQLDDLTALVKNEAKGPQKVSCGTIIVP